MCVVWVSMGAYVDCCLCVGTLATCYHVCVCVCVVANRSESHVFSLRRSHMDWTEDIYPHSEPYDPNAVQLLPVSVNYLNSQSSEVIGCLAFNLSTGYPPVLHAQ